MTVGAWVAEGAITGNVQLSAQASAVTVLAAQTAVNTARAALVAFEARSPAGFGDKDTINPQAAAQIVASTLTDPVELEAARLGAARQWLKVIALDYGADGITRTALPDVVKHDLITLGFTGQADGVARFDTDNDGYQEATEWIAPSEAMLGIDRDNNGALDSADELFNGINTPFDQRGWASLSVGKVADDFTACYELNSCLRPFHLGQMAISCIKSPRRVAWASLALKIPRICLATGVR